MTISDPSDNPALRIGHRERDAAVERLREAAGEGQITLDELETRMEAALTARTADDIKVLVADLPAPTGPAALAARAEPVRLVATHGRVERLGAWRVPAEIVAEVRHGTCVIDLRTPHLPADGVTIEVQARHSSVKLLVAGDASVDMVDVGRHHSNAKDRGARRVTTVSGPPIILTGALHHSNITIVRPRRRWFKR